MNRPYIICHMTTSLDGKVTGEHLRRENHGPVSEVYYEINRNYKADACLHYSHCESRCPFVVKQESRMEEIDQYFNTY